MIITKAISRFARNTVTTLEIVRELKDLGIDVYFEKENIFTLDSKGELSNNNGFVGSRRVSVNQRNTTWGQRKRVAGGKVSVAYKVFLGYEKGVDGTLQIVEKEVKIVRLIYQMLLKKTYA